MKFIAHDGTAYRCHTFAPDGRSARFLGCAHGTPREALNHTEAATANLASPAPAAAVPSAVAGHHTPSLSRDTEPTSGVHGPLALGL
jgi:hypothetical protein